MIKLKAAEFYLENCNMDAQLPDSYQKLFSFHLQFGESPALLLIDFMKSYTLKDGPLYSECYADAVKNAEDLLSRARALNIPVIHTRVAFLDSNHASKSLFAQKIPVLKTLIEGNVWAQFHDTLVPRESEYIIVKQNASAFFETNLKNYIDLKKIDTLIIAGVSTSGCVRATVVDAIQNNCKAFVCSGAVADKYADAHKASLVDIQAKYGEVISLQAVSEKLEMPRVSENDEFKRNVI